MSQDLTETSKQEILLPGEDTVPFIGAMHPLKVERTEVHMPAGLSIQEMLVRAQPDPALLRDAVVFVDDWEIPRENWATVRPRPGRQVTARVIPVPRGGGGGGGKSPLRTILTIAVLAATIYFAAPLGAAMFGGMGLSASVTTALGGLVIGIAGQVLINTLAPIKPPKLPELSGGAGASAESPSLFLSGGQNDARPFDVIPQVLGFCRIFPPLASKSYTEPLGDKNYLRMLLTPGYGELALSDFKIGEDALTNYEDVESESVAGTAGDADLALFTNQVDQTTFNIALTESTSWIERTSDINGDELSIDITFPQGMFRLDSNGNRSAQTVQFEINFREVGSGTWLTPSSNIRQTADSYSTGTWTITGSRQQALQHGLAWDVSSQGQYEIRIRRITTDPSDTQTFNQGFWTALRTVTKTDPVSFTEAYLAKIALRIKATDQLNSTIDSFNCIAKTVCDDWNGVAWVSGETNNPASLFRYVLQGAANVNAVADNEINLTKLQEWHDFCVANGYTFNQVRDFRASVQETLEDICAAGRAGLTLEDGKWSVVIDDTVSTVTTHITPRNSWGFQFEKGFDDEHEAWRVRFVNGDDGYRQDEMLVPFPGFTVESATVFGTLNLPGVTDPDHVYHLARYLGAVAQSRPERWSVAQDFESIVVRPGDRVRLTHDVIAAGLNSGRISSVTLNGSGYATAIDIDEPVFMDAATRYAVVVRRGYSTDTSQIWEVQPIGGAEQTSLTFITPVDSSLLPEVGDLFSFGLWGSEVEEASVLRIDPERDFAARITMVPYTSTLFDTDLETPPTFTPNLTALTTLSAPTLIQISTDESVLRRGAGDTIVPGAEIQVEPLDNITAPFLEVQQRLSGTDEPYRNSSVDRTSNDETRIFITSVRQGEQWDFRFRWNQETLLPSGWAYSPGVTIVGKSSAPDALTGLTISIFGGQAHLRWNEPTELDVRLGGRVEFRHAQAQTGASITDSVSIGQAAQARALFASLPAKAGTYFARTIDADGNIGGIVSISTKQASLLSFADVDSLDEASLFLGTHDNTFNDSGTLKLLGAGNFDDIADLDLMTANIDSYGGVSTTTGTYDFATGFDLTTVKKVRLTTRITSTIVNVNDLVDDRTDNIDDWEDFDGTQQAEADVIVFVRHTDDDPAASPTWSDWVRLESAEFEARGFDFKAELTTDSTAYNILVTELGVDVEELA